MSFPVSPARRGCPAKTHRVRSCIGATRSVACRRAEAPRLQEAIGMAPTPNGEQPRGHTRPRTQSRTHPGAPATRRGPQRHRRNPDRAAGGGHPAPGVPLPARDGRVAGNLLRLAVRGFSAQQSPQSRHLACGEGTASLLHGRQLAPDAGRGLPTPPGSTTALLNGSAPCAHPRLPGLRRRCGRRRTTAPQQAVPRSIPGGLSRLPSMWRGQLLRRVAPLRRLSREAVSARTCAAELAATASRVSCASYPPPAA